METLWNVLLGVLGNAAYFVIGVSVAYIFRLFGSKIPTSKLLSFSNLKTVSIVLPTPTRIIPGTSRTSIEEGIPVTPIGPVKGYARLSQMLAVAAGSATQNKVYFSTEFPKEMIATDLICFGRPDVNIVTNQIVATANLPFRFEGDRIVDSKSGEEICRARIEGGRVTRDYGSIIRMTNPFHDGADILIFCGCQTFGVQAAAYFYSIDNLLTILLGPPRNFLMKGLYMLGRSRIMRSLLAVFLVPFFKEAYQILVVAEVSADQVSTVKMLKWQALEK